MIRRILLLLTLPLAVAAQRPSFVVPTLPLASVDVTLPQSPGRVIRVAAGDNAALQAALDTALGSDQVVLPDRAQYIGTFTLKQHSGSAIVLRSETVPPAGVRVDSAFATMATLLAPTGTAALTTAAGANDWRIIGIRFAIATGSIDNYGIVVIGRGDETSVADQPSHIVLDRILVNADTNTTSRCVAFNGAALAVIHSVLKNCHSRGRDAQAVGGWAGDGPVLIEDNQLEASTEIIAFGGADTKVQDQTPSDITIRGNTLTRPLSWGNGPWLIKNFFELKIGERVLFENNDLRNNWANGQIGHAILFQTVNQDGGTPWSHISDVTIRNNIVHTSTHGITLLSQTAYHPVRGPMQRILIQNNQFLEIGPDPIAPASGARYFQLLGDLEDVTIVQNTFDGLGGAEVVGFDGAPMHRLVMWNNRFGATDYGLFGGGIGTAALTAHAPDAIVRGNVFTAQPEALYPPGNFFPDSLQHGPLLNDSVRIGADLSVAPPPIVLPVPVISPLPMPVPAPVDYCTLAPFAWILQPDGSQRRDDVKVQGCAAIVTLTPAGRYIVAWWPCVGSAWRVDTTTFLFRSSAIARAKKTPVCAGR